MTTRPYYPLAATLLLLSACQQQPAPDAPSPASSERVVVKNGITLPDFSGIVEEQGAAVVNIRILANPHTRQPQFSPDDPLYEFFRRFQPQAPEQPPAQGMGSGFIIAADGVILTNAHVVDQADQVMVRLSDQRELKAKVIGVDKLTDVAVLKVEANNLPTVKIGRAADSRVGEWVLAIGTPFGFENSVTAGIISAKSRALPDEGYVPFLQTDVAINPGNSGGPLFNLNGEVVGINSQIYSRSGGYQGVSFAIPIEVAIKVKQQLLEHGKVSRGRLGVMIQPLDQELASSFGLDKPQGALVSSIEPNSPADKAGLQVGDVILSLNDQPIKHSNELPPKVADILPGQAAKLDIWRKGKSIQLSVVVGEMAPQMAQANHEQPQTSSSNRLGVQLRALSPQERQQAGLSPQEGLLIVAVADGPAARVGLRPGDLILAIQGETIRNLAQFEQLLANSGNRLACLVMRDGAKQFVAIKLD